MIDYVATFILVYLGEKILGKVGWLSRSVSLRCVLRAAEEKENTYEVISMEKDKL